MQKYDCVIIGGGIVGLSVAWAILERKPDIRVTVLEKEDDVGLEASSSQLRNRLAMALRSFYQLLFEAWRRQKAAAGAIPKIGHRDSADTLTIAFSNSTYVNRF
jgi:glycine/D-amino acid oxidase-like deaminating enzyme